MSLVTTFVLISAGLLAVPALAEAVPGRNPSTGLSPLSATAIGLALLGGGIALTLLGRRRSR
jgi:LPXTG-motif cell wall-anchored protein